VAVAFLIPVSVASGPGPSTPAQAMMKAVARSNLEQALERLILEENKEGIRWLNQVVKRSVRPITKKRAKELSVRLAGMESRDTVFFWEIFLPVVWTESVFSNLINDRNLKRHKWSVGYCGLQVDTARTYAKELGYEMPKDRVEAEQWLIQHWRSNLEIGYAYLQDLRQEEIGKVAIRVMSAYRTGLTGARKGRLAITDWMKTVRQRSLRIGIEVNMKLEISQ